jgi:hypothetical protein
MKMKRSEFIRNALHSSNNTVCVNAEQVEVMLDIFEEQGMVPPLNDWALHMDGDHADPDNILYYTWEDE